MCSHKINSIHLWMIVSERTHAHACGKFCLRFFHARHEFMICPVSQWAVSFRMEPRERVMEVPGEMLSCGLPAASGFHHLGVLSHFTQSVCQRAHDFKVDLKLSFIFCQVERVSLRFKTKAPPKTSHEISCYHTGFSS